MSPFKKKNKLGIKKIKSLISSEINLEKIKVNPINVIDKAKNKFSNFYSNLKKEREKEKKRLEKKEFKMKKKNYKIKRKKHKKKDLIKLDRKRKIF